jgi:hypothetical protein
VLRRPTEDWAAKHQDDHAGGLAGRVTTFAMAATLAGIVHLGGAGKPV